MSDAGPPRWRRFLVAGAVVVVLFLVWALGRLAPVDAWIAGIEDLGAWAPVVVIALYAFTCVAFVPGTILTVACGSLFGFGGGTLTAVIGSNLGAQAAFLVGRHAARGAVERRLAQHPRLRALDAAVESEGMKIVLLTRLSPVFPFNVLNYGYGLTGVRFRDYALGSLIGMLPGTVAYVYVGSLLRDLAESESRERTPVEWALVVLGLVATLVLAWYLARVARRKVDERLAVPEAGA